MEFFTIFPMEKEAQLLVFLVTEQKQGGALSESVSSLEITSQLFELHISTVPNMICGEKKVLGDCRKGR